MIMTTRTRDQIRNEAKKSIDTFRKQVDEIKADNDLTRDAKARKVDELHQQTKDQVRKAKRELDSIDQSEKESKTNKLFGLKDASASDQLNFDKRVAELKQDRDNIPKLINKGTEASAKAAAKAAYDLGDMTNVRTYAERIGKDFLADDLESFQSSDSGGVDWDMTVPPKPRL